MNQQLNLMWAAQQNRDMQSVFDLMQQSVNNGAGLAQSFGRNTPSPAFQCAINDGGPDNERAEAPSPP
jgi:hypothetical protein